MPRVALNHGAYTARSLIANAQRCVNLYPEVNQDDAPVPVTQYETPGLTVKVRPANGPCRGIYRAATGATFVCVGNSVYFLNLDWSYTLVGTIDSSNPNIPVSMSDNGVIMVLVDSTSKGYWLRLGSTDLNRIDDEAFYGAYRVQYLDGFFVFNRPLTNQFYLSPSFWNGTDPFDPLYIASKIGGADQILSISVRHRELLLIGQVTSEVWYNAGASDFPFERLPGVFLQYGSSGRYSVAEADLSTFILARNNDGQNLIMQIINYEAVRVSTHAIENTLENYPVINDCIAFSYQQDGHTFVLFTFPDADATWAYDLATKEWHERVWTDEDGVEHRHRAQCSSIGYNHTVICGDRANGKVYAWDLNNGTDDGDPIVRRRGFPHLQNDGKRISHIQFQLDVQVGDFPGSPDPGAQLMLRWSDTKGYSWSNTIKLAFGTTGEYERSLSVRRLGIARDRVYEVYWSRPKVALQGAWIETEMAET